ncbi:MAG: hypothetical protein AAGF01_03720 [Cyanobacteria bacterium P01_G01_bin.38]
MAKLPQRKYANPRHLQRLKRWQQRLRHNPQLAFVLGLLAIFLSIVLVALNPGQHPFETQLVASKISFTTDEPSTHFLKDIRPVPAITIRGKQNQALRLSGKFSSETLPELSGISDLTIELPYPDSSFQFQADVDKQQCLGGDIEINSLQLAKQTHVTELSYRSYNRILDLAFEQDDNISEDALSSLELILNGCLSMMVEGYRIPELNLEESDTTMPLQLEFLPASSDWQFRLPVLGSLSVDLPTMISDVNAIEWLWGDLEVRDVKFLDRRTTGSGVEDYVDYSTIQSGIVRMVDQELEIGSNQFLIVAPSGLQRIRTFQLLDSPDGSDQALQGIEIRAVGKTSEVQVGLDTDFPIRGIRSNILAQLVPPNTMVAIVSFSGAMVATLLSWLVDNLFKSSS